jgi:AAA domain
LAEGGEIVAESVTLLDAAGLAAARTTAIRWLWHDYLAAGMTTLLTSRGKEGKTTLLSLLLERLQSGRPLAGAPLLAKSAVVISEEPPEHWHVRAETLGLKDHVKWICRPLLMRPEPQEWMSILKAARDAKPDLVVIDSFAHFFPDNRENSPDRLLEALRPLHQITMHGVAVLLMHHPRSGTRRGEVIPRGTGALAGFADILMTMQRLPDATLTDRRRVVNATSRLGGASTRCLELTADGLDYAVVPDPAAPSLLDGYWEVLAGLLEDKGESTQRQLRTHWPEDHDRPSKPTLARWLSAAVATGKLSRNGQGRVNEPYRYALTALTRRDSA